MRSDINIRPKQDFRGWQVMLVSNVASTISGLISLFKLNILILFPSGLTVISQTRKLKATMWDLMLMHSKLDEIRV